VVSAYTPSAARVGQDAAGEYAVGPDFKVDAVLTGTVNRLSVEGVEVKTHSPKGDPGDAIVEVAVQEGADLIVLGSRGMQGARRILGSVPNKVSHNAPCDLLIVQTT
jgi:nucleotide-binding universal stress UspA family protein